MNKLGVVTLCVLFVGVSFIIWQVEGAGATASVQEIAVTQAATDTDDAASRHQLSDVRLHIAQIMWKDDVPEKLAFYKSCLKFDEQYGEWGIPPCKELDASVQHELQRQIEDQAKQAQQ